MIDERRSGSPGETGEIARALAGELWTGPVRPVFVMLKGELGAGKSEFARAFISEWLRRAEGDTPAAAMPSPTFNIAIVYGARARVAHLDLYRLDTMAELEQLGYEHYFYEQDCCLVEWLDRVPGGRGLAPPGAVEVELAFETETESSSSRRITIRGLRRVS